MGIWKNIAWLGVLSIAILLGACGSEVDLEELDPQGQKVVFWYQHTLEREAAMQALIEEFNRTNPHSVEVRGEFAGDYNDIYNKMRLGIQEGSLPQLAVAYAYQAQVYYQADGVVDLTPYLKSPRWGLSAEARADYVQAFLEGDKVQGVQVAFRPQFSMELLYFNADWLRELGYEAPPRNWDEFAEMCRRATEQPFSRSADPERSLGLLLEVDASRLASMVFSRGGDFMNPWRRAYTFNTPQVKNALALVSELVDCGAIELFREPHADRKTFASGQALFALCSSARVSLFRSAVDSSGGVVWDIAPLPYEGGKPVINMYGASLAVCKTTPEQQLAAWLFIKWFTEPAQQNRWVQGSNYFPVRKSAAPELADYFRTAFHLLEYGKSEPGTARYESVRRMIENAMVKIVDGADMDRVLSQLEREANKTL
ncbi:MAG: extracellular solute-binding protein [Gemmatimonadetes bacterium]|nr:extracellular solute-binding protein [Gemmatimonadota bacterium]